jgi:hypothetical protein
MRTLLIGLAALCLQACTTVADAGSLLDLEIIDRTTGRVLETWPHRGERYVAGNPGERYAVRLINRSATRVLAVLSVDGVNAVSGETAAPGQSGYVLEPYASAEISGWRKSMQEVAQFYFTSLPDSYAARTDRPDNVGVIGVAVFRERARPRVQPSLEAPRSKAAPAPSAASGAAQDAASNPFEARAEREASRLGTGHGEREYAPTEYTEFQRASRSPSEIVTLRYDSRSNLLAMGVIPKAARWPQPEPFPARFVPDPR